MAATLLGGIIRPRTLTALSWSVGITPAGAHELASTAHAVVAAPGSPVADAMAPTIGGPARNPRQLRVFTLGVWRDIELGMSAVCGFDFVL